LNWPPPAKKGRRWRVLAALVLAVTGVVLVQAGRASAASPPLDNDGSLLYHGWNPVGGISQGTPAVTTWAGGRLDVFVRGGDNNLWQKAYAGSWSAWQNLGAPPGGLTSDPAAVAWSPGRIDVFVAGAGGQVWHTAYVGWWTAWQPLGGIAVGAPAVSSWAAGRLDVFVRGGDNQLWHLAYNGAWWPWEARGGDLTSAPAAVSWGPDRIDVVARGTDMAAWHAFYDHGYWAGFTTLGGVLAYGPGVTSWGPGRLDVYVAGSDHRLYHQWLDGLGLWSGWLLAQDAALTSALAPVAVKFGQIDVFGRGTDSGVWQGIGALPARQCSASNLSISLGQTKQTSLISYAFPVFFANRSSTACYLNGPPVVSALDSAGNPIGLPPEEYGGYGPVPLTPGGMAIATVGWLADPVYYFYCPTDAVAAQISITPPGSTTATVLPSPGIAVCTPGDYSKTNWSVSGVISPALFQY
jgi:hypothetical protein